MIILDRKTILAEGKTRQCYLHPEDESKVIKIVKQNLSSMDGNEQEWKHYRFLKNRFKDTSFLVKCHGFVETSMGKGLIFDCTRDHDRKISRTLLDIVSNSESRYDVARVFSVVDSFCCFIIENNIQFFDLNPGNIVIKVFSDGSYKAFAVDIKGRYANCEFIPISTYIPFFSRKKLERRSRQLMERMQSHLKQRQ